MIILPICLLLFNAAQEIVEYILPRFIPNPYYRTAVLIVLFVVGFAIIGDILVPWIAELLDKGHKTSKTQAGKLGVILFYSGTFASIDAIVERYGKTHYILLRPLIGIDYPMFGVDEEDGFLNLLFECSKIITITDDYIFNIIIMP